MQYRPVLRFVALELKENGSCANAESAKCELKKDCIHIEKIRQFYIF